MVRMSAVAALLTGFLALGSLPLAAEDLWLTGATLIDGTGAAPVSGVSLRVSSGRIAEVRRSGSVTRDLRHHRARPPRLVPPARAHRCPLPHREPGRGPSGAAVGGDHDPGAGRRLPEGAGHPRPRACGRHGRARDAGVGRARAAAARRGVHPELPAVRPVPEPPPRRSRERGRGGARGPRSGRRRDQGRGERARRSGRHRPAAARADLRGDEGGGGRGHEGGSLRGRPRPCPGRARTPRCGRGCGASSTARTSTTTRSA